MKARLKIIVAVIYAAIAVIPLFILNLIYIVSYVIVMDILLLTARLFLWANLPRSAKVCIEIIDELPCRRKKEN